ncbi:CD109 antigen [Cetorhinus maximus]
MTFTVCPLQDRQPPLRITAQISKDGQNLSSAEGTFPPGTIGTLILPTEGLSVSRYQLAVQGYAEQMLLFSNWTDVDVVTEDVSILIQTDKAIYKPGQTVKMRAICIYPDLKPYLGKISVIIRSPRKSVIQQWLDLETTLGVVSKEFPLSPNSLLGNWYIQVTSNGLQKEKTFTVAEYVLSRFEVLINTSSVYLPLDQMSITGTVTGRYLYGKPVKGNVTVTISFPYISSTINKTFEVVSRGQVVFAGKSQLTTVELTPELSWAPSASLIAYYITEDGQIVSDALDLNVEGIFANKVSLSWSKDQVKPADNVSLSVSTSEDQSFIGVLVVDKSVQLLKGGNDLTEAMVIQELKGAAKDNIAFANGCSSSTVTLQRTVPDSLTTWIASAFAISKNQGLQLATTPAELEVFKSFFLEMNLPYSITRGEQLILEINIFNYLQQTLEVWVTVELNDLFDFIIVPDEKDAAPNKQKGSVLSQDSRVFYFPIKLKGLGKVPVTVKATSEVAFDAVTKYILVKAEGIQQSFSQSLFVAPKASGQLWSKEVEFTFPDNVVDGSETAHVTVIGDILGPSINGLEDLLQMPYGCGEQNMIRFAPNVYILQYFTAINQVNEEIKEKALSYMIQGYQRELTYQRSDGSFSAFGNSDYSGSTWLSAFVLRCFLQAQSFIYIDTSVLDETIYWIMRHQDEIGEFSEPGRVIHSELQGGQSGPISLTAYILTALLEDQSYLSKVSSQVSDSVTYLEDKLQNGISSNYTLSLVTYALTLANSSFATQALDELNRRADEKDGVKFWSSPIKRGSTWWSQQPLSSDIEVAAYALLSHLRQGRLLEGIPIMQWLSECRNHLGGFSSTQDTVVALQALSQFAAQSFSPATSLTVTVSGPGLPTPAVFSITSKNAIVLQTRQIGIQQPMLVTVTAQGQGLAIFQLNILFNLESKVASKRRRSVESQEVFDLDVDILDDKDDLDHVTLHICTRYRGGENSSNTGMVLMEVGMLSGFVPEMEGVRTNDLIKKVEFEAGKVNLYFDSLNETEVCVTIPVIRDSKVAHAQDAVVSIFEYYEPGRRAVRTYNSQVMSDIDSCTFCGFNCSLCRSQFGAVSVPSAALPTLAGRIPLALCLLSIYLNLS